MEKIEKAGSKVLGGCLRFGRGGRSPDWVDAAANPGGWDAGGAHFGGEDDKFT